MASIDFLNKRIAGKQAELEKLNKKLERILKAKESDWQNNPYYYHEDDIRITNRDIERIKAEILEYEAAIKTEQEKDASRDVKVILDFLENWKQRVFQQYDDDFKAYYKAKEDFKNWRAQTSQKYESPWTPWSDEDNETQEKMRQDILNKTSGYYERRDFTNRWGKPDYQHVKIREGEWEYIMPYVFSRTYEEAVDKLKRTLDQEAKAKYDFIINRVNAICGKITDASNLSIGEKGDLNGLIIGERGKARVETIGAGGHNVQIFHFRTLIKPVK